MTIEGDVCTQCGHPSDPHELCTALDPPLGGWVRCPVEGCKCFSTWSVSANALPSADTYAGRAAGESEALLETYLTGLRLAHAALDE